MAVQVQSTPVGAAWPSGWTAITPRIEATTTTRYTYTHGRFDAPLDSGQRYRFQVRAHNAAGWSDWSDPIPNAAGIQPPPDAPPDFTATAGDGQVVLGWTALRDPTITEYLYQYRRHDAVRIASEAAGAAGAAGAVDPYPEQSSYTPVASDVGWQLRATVSYRDGHGPNKSKEREASAAVIGSPSAPQEFKATAGDGQVSLRWIAPASDGGSAITHYAFRQSADGGSTWQPDWTPVGLATSQTRTALMTTTPRTALSSPYFWTLTTTRGLATPLVPILITRRL